MNAPLAQPDRAPAFRLTDLAHGGGCGCKLAPSVLQDLLAGQPATAGFPDLLVGTETGDDAAAFRIEGDRCIIATTDFFMPIVDDPHDFGRIAATNAISDVYAMGGRPLMALAILGMPVGRIAPETIRGILAGGASVCAEAGIPVAGGHSIDAPEPIYGLAVIGICPVGNLRRNSEARAGDALILTKPLGVGIYSSAFKKRELGVQAYDELIATTTRLNAIGADLAGNPDVHAMTDVTGFGILGHGLEMARGSGLRLTIDRSALPLLSEAASLAQAGCVTGASQRNWTSYGHEVALPEGMAEWQRHLLADPQTSGGLLVAVAPASAGRILDRIRAAGHPAAAVIGSVSRDVPGITVV
ncbi:MAG: selenide, water dikinase SelD [Rhizobiales bacterium]|nr:selenide, water dikinase SelD [Hyphomicrobiales bacterium]OJU30044.1 MAG: selenide, water dikinase SelD [Rhizobiales bacterium 68-8]